MRIKSYAHGVTLIELLVVVAVIAILAAIAVPSYQQYVREGRRVDAQAIMLDLQLREEKHRASNSSYFADDGTGASSWVSGINSNNAYYTFTITAGANSYTISADPKGAQAGDTSCDPMTLDQSGSKSPSACWKS